MNVIVNEKMMSWTRDYIRSHRNEGVISIHVVFSKFNEDFRATFKIDPVVAVRLMIGSGHLKGAPSRGGFSIWLPEDEGNGKRRPFRPSNPKAGAISVDTNQNQPAIPVHQNGDHEMKNEKKNEDTAVDPHYAFEKIPHPETGKVDVLELIRYIMQHFHEKLPQKPEMDGGYAIIKLQIYDALGDVGVPTGSRPEISRILQEMALIKSYGRSQWGVLHNRAANYFISAKSYNVAKQATIERNKRNSKMARLEKKLKQFEDSVVVHTDTSVNNSTSFEDEAVLALAEAERLAEELEKSKTHAAQLELECARLTSELAARPSSAEAAKLALQERLAALKKSGTS